MSRMNAPRILAVIPVREGSKGIPRKNMRLLNGRPLIDYVLHNAMSCRFITDIAVSTDSEEILSYISQKEGIYAIRREPALADDLTTLDPVIYDALCQMEIITGKEYGIIVTLQATSPLLTTETLESAIASYLDADVATLISAVNEPHLFWHRDDDGRITPSYRERANRQELPPCYVETGAFLITDRHSICRETRIGAKVDIFEVPSSESVDIDTVDDWARCESALRRKRIVFRVDGHRGLGMGHVYRTLTLAYSLTEHDVRFVCTKNHRDGIEKLRQANMSVIEVEDDNGFIDWLAAEEGDIDIVVCDQLDTDRDYIDAIKTHVPRVVCFEDLGSGGRHADAVINALYESTENASSTAYYSGEQYACLRDEFLLSQPRGYRERVERIFVMFGGSDPLDLTSRVYELAKRINESKIKYRFDFVLGLAYNNDSVIDLPELDIYIHKDVRRVSDYMRNADLAFSSQGRSTFELAALGIPTIVMAENSRETTHRFAEMANGFINLGIGDEVSDEDLERTLKWIVGSPTIRREMHNNMLKKDLKSGIQRVKKIILGEYL